MYTLVNVYVALPVFTRIAGTLYADFYGINGSFPSINSGCGTFFHLCWCFSSSLG